MSLSRDLLFVCFLTFCGHVLRYFSWYRLSYPDSSENVMEDVTISDTSSCSAARCHPGRGAGHHEEMRCRNPDSPDREPTEFPGAHGEQRRREASGRHHGTLSETAARHGLKRGGSVGGCTVVGPGAVIGPCSCHVLRYRDVIHAVVALVNGWRLLWDA